MYGTALAFLCLNDDDSLTIWSLRLQKTRCVLFMENPKRH